MISAMLSMIVLWFLLYGRISVIVTVPVCLGIGAFLAFAVRHKHTQFLTIDVLAQASHMNKVNPSLKFWLALALMAVCASAGSPFVGLIFALAMMLIVVLVGGLKLNDYIHMLGLPVSFLMLSALALMFEVSQQSAGIFSVRISGFWICMSADSQARAALVTSRALGAVSCLYMLSLTTPMSELIGVLRRARCPAVLIELMYLIYRYIFILLNMYHTMRNAAKSRLGYSDFHTSVRTTGMLYSNLLGRSYRQASANFDAMESRCFGNEIRFLENKKEVTRAQAAAAFGLVAAAACLWVLLR